MDKVYYCVRVYADHSAKHTYRNKEGMESWVEYNGKSRGNALFVDGILIEGSVFISEAAQKSISEKLLKEIADGLHNKPAERVGKQAETFGGFTWIREGYREDWEREHLSC